MTTRLCVNDLIRQQHQESCDSPHVKGEEDTTDSLLTTLPRSMGVHAIPISSAERWWRGVRALISGLMVMVAGVPAAVQAQTFSVQPLDSGVVTNVGQHTSIALINGNPAIAYYDVTNGDLKYIRANDATGTTWGAPQTVDTVNDVGQYPSLITVNGRPAISYHDVTNGDLRYVRASDANGTAWSAPVTVHSAGDTGHFTSMRVINGNPAIAFYDVTLKELEYIRATDVDGTTWPVSHTIVDTTTGNDVGQYASLAVVGGNPAISYYDAQGKDLIYVRATDVSGTAWGSGVLVDAGGGASGTGQYTSLVMANGNPAISYHDAQNGDLHFIRASDATGATWPTSTPVVVDTGGDTGHYTAMTIVGGMPVISYYDVTNGDLHYVTATNANGTTWSATPVNVDSTGNVGQYTSIVALSGGSVGISYYDVTNGDLKYARMLPPPTVTSVTPSVGAPSGGTLITIIGTGFTGATAVTIGGVAVTSFIVVDDFTITATVAAGTVGQKKRGDYCADGHRHGGQCLHLCRL